jgi:hypothetical protein
MRRRGEYQFLTFSFYRRLMLFCFDLTCVVLGLCREKRLRAWLDHFDSLPLCM